MEQQPQGPPSIDTAYLSTRPGIMKAVTNVVAFITLIVVAIAFDGAFVVKHSSSCGESVPCKSSPLPRFGLAVVILTWLLFLALLIVSILPQVNRKPQFAKADYWGHLISGICLVVAFFFFIGFVAIVYIKKPCNESKEDSYIKSCSFVRSHNYSPIVFGIGAIFVLTTGILAIVTSMFNKRGGRSRMMAAGGQQGSMAPSQAQMQTQGTPSQQANNSVRQSPSSKTDSPSQAAENA